MAIVTGIVVGILGVEGWSGFLPHIAVQLLVSVVIAIHTLPSFQLHGSNSMCLPAAHVDVAFSLVCTMQCAAAMVFKGAASPKKYFHTWWVFITRLVFQSDGRLVVS